MNYKRVRKSTVQLTSLLDLLFVMIFVSLIQQKQVDAPAPKIEKRPITKTNEAPPPKAKVFAVQAIFKFHATPSNPGIPEGEYVMNGTFKTETGKLSLGGSSWLKRPKNYDMVPLSGVIKPELGLFEGQIEFQGCQKFTLKREVKGEGSPIAGTWTGTYKCTQGETGLILKLQ